MWSGVRLTNAAAVGLNVLVASVHSVGRSGALLDNSRLWLSGGRGSDCCKVEVNTQYLRKGDWIADPHTCHGK